MRRCAAQERGVKQVGAPCAARHRHASGGTHGSQHRLGAGRNLAAGTGDHDADRVEQVAPRIVAHFVGQRVVAQRRL